MSLLRHTAALSRSVLVRLSALVLCGATVGTLARASLEDAAPHAADQWPWVTFGINLAGSFLLGGLLEILALAGSDDGWRRAVRLGVGTGMIGGFTTYSTYVLEIDSLTRADQLPLAVAYAFISTVAGIAAAATAMGLVGALAGDEPMVEDGDAA